MPSRVNGSIVQRFKPVFEQQPTIPLSHESKPIRQQQSVSIPYTYQIGKATKATCLDDVLPLNVRRFARCLWKKELSPLECLE